MSELPEVMIKVENLYKTFKLPHEKVTSVKSAIVGFHKRKKTYEKQQALQDVSFEVCKGDFFGIVGRNGSGKSTLLKLLAGIYTPDKGTIVTNGRLTPFIELGVGFNPELTGRENVFLNGALLGFNRKEMLAMYDDIVEFAEIEKFMDQKLKNYSSGMQVRLAFSIAIRAESDVLILDEVLAVGDANFQQKCFDYFEEIKQSNKTIILVTHDMSMVKRFCDKALLLEYGVQKKVGSPEEIADQYMADNIAISNSKTQPNADSTDETCVKKLEGSLKTTELSREDTLKFNVNYVLNEEFDPVLGIAIVQNGTSVAEINSKAITLDKSPNSRHGAELSIKLSSFNPGVYSLNVAIFKRNNGELLDSRIGVTQFIIKGEDVTRGAATYIDGGWSKTKPTHG